MNEVESERRSINEDSVDAQDNVLVKVDRDDVIRRLSWRVKRSRTFLTIYIAIILANLFILIWEVIGTAVYTVSITLEALINLVFLVEVIVEIITQDKYFRKCWNVIDFSICMLCIISFVVFCIYDSTTEDGSSSLFSTSVENLTEADDDDSIAQDDDGELDLGDTESVPLDISDVDMVLILIRYIFQSIRLCRYMATVAKRKKTQVLEEDVQFPDSEGEDFPMTKGRVEYMNYEVITPGN